MTLTEAALLVLLAGWAAADTTAAFQFMTGQALVSGWLAGLILGHPALGLFMGAALQLVWSYLTPVGAAAYPDVGPGTIGGVAVTTLLMRHAPGFLKSAGSPAEPAFAPWRMSPDKPFPEGDLAVACLLGLLAAIAIGRFGQFLTVFLRRDNARLAHAADRAAGRGSYFGVEIENAFGVLRSFGRGVMLMALAVPAWLIASLLFRPTVLGQRGAGGPGFDPHRWFGPHAPVNPGLVLFWWIGVAALATVFWRGGRRDWGALIGGAVFGAVLWIIR